MVRFVNPFHESGDRFNNEPKGGEGNGHGREDDEEGKGKHAPTASPEAAHNEEKVLQDKQVAGDVQHGEKGAGSGGDDELVPPEDGKLSAVDVGKEPACGREVDEFFVEEDGRAVATFPVDAYWNAQTRKGSQVANPGFTADDYAAIEGHFEKAGKAFRNATVQSMEMCGVEFGIGNGAFFQELIDNMENQCTFLYARPEDESGVGSSAHAHWRVPNCPEGRIRALLKIVRGAGMRQRDRLRTEVFANTCYTLQLGPAVAVEDDAPETKAYRTVERMLVWLPVRYASQTTSDWSGDEVRVELPSEDAHEHADDVVILKPEDADAFLDQDECAKLVQGRTPSRKAVSANNHEMDKWEQYYRDELSVDDEASEDNVVFTTRFLGDLFHLWWAARKRVYQEFEDWEPGPQEESRFKQSDVPIGKFRKIWNAVEWTSAKDVTVATKGNFSNVERLRFPKPPFEFKSLELEVWDGRGGRSISTGTLEGGESACPSRAIVQSVLKMRSSPPPNFNAFGESYAYWSQWLTTFGNRYVGMLFEPNFTPLQYGDAALEKFCTNVAQAGMRAILQVLEVATSPWSGTRFCSLRETLVKALAARRGAGESAGESADRAWAERNIQEGMKVVVTKLHKQRDELLARA